MEQVQVCKRVCLPAQHIRFDFINRVPTWGGPKASNCFPASPPVDLRCTSHMKAWIHFELQRSGNLVMDFPSANAQLRISAEVFKALFEVIDEQSSSLRRALR